jgi:8-amino-7-oxononanoate synthase
MDLFERCQEIPFGKQLESAGFHAYYRVLQSGPDAEVMVDGRRVLMLGSNNYLGLASHPRVKRAATDAIEKWGTGTTGSRVLNGTLDLHLEVEAQLARFLRRDAALFFTSGYMANLGVLSGLAHRGDVVVVDRLAHASIVDGARLSGAEIRRFRHNDAQHLRRILASCEGKATLVAIDGVYSMEGDIAPLPRIVEACRAHDARLVLDDAHGLGVLGRDGRGTAEHFGLEDRVDLIVGTTSKSLPAVGGFAAADQHVVDYLRYALVNRPFIFAASAPPAAVAAVSAALTVLEQEPGLRRRLWAHTRKVQHALRGMGLDIGATETPIVPVRIGSVEQTFEIWKQLTAEGIFVNVVLPPGVPAGGCLIRMTLTAHLEDAHVDRLIDAMSRVAARLRAARDLAGEGEVVVKKAG